MHMNSFFGAAQHRNVRERFTLCNAVSKNWDENLYDDAIELQVSLRQDSQIRHEVAYMLSDFAQLLHRVAERHEPRESM